MSKTVKMLVLAVMAAAALTSCNLGANNYSNEGCDISLEITPPAVNSTGLSAAEFGVSNVWIYLCNTNGGVYQSIQWQPVNGVMYTNLRIPEPGRYKVVILHMGTNWNGQASAKEEVLINVEPMIITTVRVIPGYVASLVVTPFFDYIPNGDFRNVTGVTPTGYTQYRSGTASNIWMSSYENRTGVVRMTSSGTTTNYCYFTLYTNTNMNLAPINSTMYLGLTFKVSNGGTTTAGANYPPLYAYFYFVSPDNLHSVSFYRYYNISHDSYSTNNSNFELVPQNSWTTRWYSTAQMGVPFGYSLRQITIYSYGTSRNVYIDSIELQ